MCLFSFTCYAGDKHDAHTSVRNYQTEVWIQAVIVFLGVSFLGRYVLAGDRGRKVKV